VARAEAYLQAKFHLDPCNRLATVHQRHSHRQGTQTDTENRQDNGPIAQGEQLYKRSPNKTTTAATAAAATTFYAHYADELQHLDGREDARVHLSSVTYTVSIPFTSSNERNNFNGNELINYGRPME